VSKALVAALAAAAMLAGAMPLSDASAMTFVAPSWLGTASAPPLTRIAVICGISGCARVQVSRAYRPPPNFVKRAAPLIFPPTGSQKSSAPSAPANN
jgi:hypothetical protein